MGGGRRRQERLTTCPYPGCKLRCPSESSHRAKYAYMSMKWRERVLELDQEVKKTRSDRINYDVLKSLGILWPLESN